MTLRMTKRAARLAAVGILLGASSAWAAGPLTLEVRGDGTCASGATLTASGTAKGAGFGGGTYSAAIDPTGGVPTPAYTLPGSGTCNAADGTVTMVRSGSNLVVDVSGVVCEVGLAGVGSALVPNDVFEGAYQVDGGASTGTFSGYSGSGKAVVGCSPTTGAATHVNGVVIRP